MRPSAAAQVLPRIAGLLDRAGRAGSYRGEGVSSMWSGKGPVERARVVVLAACLLLSAGVAHASSPQLVLWAWERPEDLRFAGPEIEVAAQTGFVVLSGQGVMARGRRFPLLTAPGQPRTAVIHVQIDRRSRLAWTPAQRRAAAEAVLRYARAPWTRRVQVDFEVRRSERQVLLDLLHDVRAGLPRGVPLSMTALASWCETEDWLKAAPVDEIAPMLFRMGPQGEAVTARLAAGRDFADPRCRRAVAISVDAPLPRVPTQRRVYLFSPRSWTAADFHIVQRRVEAWSSPGG
jgi:hypothetical protein